MICPRCGNGRTGVYNTRDVKCGEVKRSRKCNKCGYTFHTREITKDTFDKMATICNMYAEAIDTVQKGMKLK